MNDVQKALENAWARLQKGHFAEAIKILDSVLRQDPRNFAALHLRSLASYYSKDMFGALQYIERALSVRNDVSESFNTYGIILKAHGRLSDAIIQFKRAISKSPNYKDALYNIGNCYQETGALDRAVEFYDRALQLDKNLIAALNNKGLVLLQLHNHQEAIDCFTKALERDPSFAEAYYNRGNALVALESHKAAIVDYDHALKLKPVFPAAHCNRANALRAIGFTTDALEGYDKALSQDPMFAEAYVSKANLLRDLGRIDDAINLLLSAIRVKPRYPEAYNNLGNALTEEGRHEEALENFTKALEFKPDYPEAYINRGNTLVALRLLSDALRSYEAAIAIRPDHAEAYCNRGAALRELGRFNEALESYSNAIALKPDYAEAYRSRAAVLSELKRFSEALVDYDTAIRLKPNLDYLRGNRLLVKMMVCDWEALDSELLEIERDIRAGRKVIYPWAALAIYDQPELHLSAARVFVSDKVGTTNTNVPVKRAKSTGKIRVGYYSADFHNHATSYLIAELLEEHDNDRFEFFGFSFGPPANDQMRNRVSKAFDAFHDISDMRDDEVASMSRKLGIDIAVDLKGYTKDSRAGIFAHRCAPIQVNYLGYPGTLGADYIDYIVADSVLIPEAYRSHYSEKIIYLPGSYQVNDSKRKVSSKVFDRNVLGLPEGAFVFCCFNNNYKIMPESFESWMRILKTVDGSVLWLFKSDELSALNLRMEAQRRGVSPERIIFAEKMPLDEHLSRHRCADLFLDTIPYNAHTTASDSLWAGLPVLTCAGTSFASRVAASLLSALGLEELIVDNRSSYERIACDLALNPIKLSELKRRLEIAKNSSGLFSGVNFARKLELAYSEIHRRHLEGLPPEHIYG